MPFVTEELYQRLGRRPGDSVETIVKARYPVEEPSYANDKDEKELDTVFELVKAVRSLAVQKNLSKGSTVYVQTDNAELAALMESEKLSIRTLAKGIGVERKSTQDQLEEGSHSIRMD